MIESNIIIAISVIILFIIVFTIDYLFLRHLFWKRLIVNIAIVLVYFFILFKLGIILPH